VDAESQFLPDSIFKHRRKPYAKMGHLKRKADASTHISPPQGLSGHHCYSGIWDRSRKATPFTSSHLPSAAPPAHCRTMPLTGLHHQPRFSVKSRPPPRKPAFSLLRRYSWEGTSTTHCLSSAPLPPAPAYCHRCCLFPAGPERQQLKTSSSALMQEKH